MCIIMYQEAGDSQLEKAAFERAERVNSDGMGIAFPDNGELNLFRTMDDLDALVERYRWARNNEKAVLVHFRLATQGTVTEDNCQPFRVRDDLVMAHNGNMRFTTLPEGWSDSRYFGDAVLSDLSPDLMSNPAIFHLLEYYIGNSNKVAIMDAEGNATILNEDRGHWESGTWFSNYSYTPIRSSNRSYNNIFTTDFEEEDDDEQEGEYCEIQGDVIEEGCLYKGDTVCYGCLPEGVDDNEVWELYESTTPAYCKYCSMWLSKHNPHIVAQRNRAEA